MKSHPFHFIKTVIQPFFYCMSIMLALGLSACGGGGGGSTQNTTVVSTNTSLIAPGVYIGNDVNGKEWVGILQLASSGLSNFYGLYYLGNDPDLYTASGQLTGGASASISSVVLFEDYTKQIARTGTGTLSSSQNNAVKIDFNFPATSTANGKQVIFSATTTPSGYNPSTLATLSSISGDWSGRWTFGGVGNADFRISITPEGNVTSAGPFQAECFLTEGKLTASENNLFTFSVRIPTQTLCTSFGGKTLNGVAFIQNSPVAGKTQRLYLVGVTPDGRGVSFKADR